MATAEARVKERPILFAAPMVKAILEGRKTMTRRVVKPQPPAGSKVWQQIDESRSTDRFMVTRTSPHHEISCPYGRPGNTLWCRETFRFAAGLDSKSPSAIADSCVDAGYRRPWAPIRYEADGKTSNRDSLPDFGGEWGKARVSIHMPRWASRITLEITGVRVERLQSISEADKLAEGATPEVPFGTVWREINTKPGVRWSDDPFVWCISFRRLEARP